MPRRMGLPSDPLPDHVEECGELRLWARAEVAVSPVGQKAPERHAAVHRRLSADEVLSHRSGAALLSLTDDTPTCHRRRPVEVGLINRPPLETCCRAISSPHGNRIDSFPSTGRRQRPAEKNIVGILTEYDLVIQWGSDG
jgi:hypothetical protein